MTFLLDVVLSTILHTVTKARSVPPQHPCALLRLLTLPVSLVLADALSWLFSLCLLYSFSTLLGLALCPGSCPHGMHPLCSLISWLPVEVGQWERPQQEIRGQREKELGAMFAFLCDTTSSWQTIWALARPSNNISSPCSYDPEGGNTSPPLPASEYLNPPVSYPNTLQWGVSSLKSLCLNLLGDSVTQSVSSSNT